MARVLVGNFKGPKGDKGEPGTPGATGAKGDKGDPGTPGTTGAKGDKGDPGTPGATGAKGDKGDPGTPGTTGAKGDKGDKGDPGAGLPAGGTAGQIPYKINATDYNLGWRTASSSSLSANTVVMRGTSGRIVVGAPSTASEAATKGYVDGLQPEDTGWVTLTPATGYTGRLEYRVIGNQAWLRGAVSGAYPKNAVTTISSSLLPASARPDLVNARGEAYMTGNSNGAAAAQVDGSIIVYHGNTDDKSTAHFYFGYLVD